MGKKLLDEELRKVRKQWCWTHESRSGSYRLDLPEFFPFFMSDAKSIVRNPS